MSEITDICPECNSFQTGSGMPHHSPACSMMSESFARSELKRYAHAYSELCKDRNKFFMDLGARIIAAREKTVLWHGKFEIVRRENNELRRQIRALKKP